MAKLRPARCYKSIERPYTRRSRYKKKSYVPSAPGSKLNVFHMGDTKAKFNTRVSLIAKDAVQIRNNSLEAARVASNRYLNITLGKAYHFRVKLFPHHIIRQKSLATGAGADRFSTGMSKAWGKPIGSAAQVKPGKEILYVDLDGSNVGKAKIALDKARKKLPCRCTIEVRRVSS